MSAPALMAQIQGVTTVSADNLNTYMQTCDTVSELRGFIGITGIEVSVRGTNAVNDGGAGAFYWNATGTGPDDGVNVIVPTGSVEGCWVRLATSSNYSFATTAALLTYFPSTFALADGTVATTGARATEGDKGGGTFQYIQSSAASDNGGNIRVDGAGRRWIWTSPGPINTALFGAITTATDNTTALQDAINAAFALGGQLNIAPPGIYKYATGLTLPASAGTLKIYGVGRPQGFQGGVDSDPATLNGAVLQYTGSTGDAFSTSISSNGIRQYLTLENFTLQGNSNGSSGHGVHLQCTNTGSGILVCYRDFTVIGAAQSNIFHDGAVFESQLYNVRSDQAGDRGFKAALNTGLPGETRFFGGTFDSNVVGIDLSGGGHFSLHGVSATANSTAGLNANGVSIQCVDINLELNGTSTGSQANFTLNNGIFIGTSMSVVTGSTGSGISCVGCIGCEFIGYGTNSSTSGSGYSDILFDNTGSRNAVYGYSADDSVNRITWGDQGGNIQMLGGQPATSLPRNQSYTTVSATGNVTPNTILYSSCAYKCTGSGMTLTVTNPQQAPSGPSPGTVLDITIYNDTGGSLTVDWGNNYKMDSSFSAPANGKRRKISFEYVGTDDFWEMRAASTGDM